MSEKGKGNIRLILNNDELEALAAQGLYQEQIAKKMRCSGSSILRYRKDNINGNGDALERGWSSYFNLTGKNHRPLTRAGRDYKKTKVTEWPDSNSTTPIVVPNIIELSKNVLFHYKIEGDIFSLTDAGQKKLMWLIESLRAAK